MRAVAALGRAAGMRVAVADVLPENEAALMLFASVFGHHAAV